MTPEQQAAYVNAQAVCALARIAGMMTANSERRDDGKAIAYDEEAFDKVASQFGISHNQLVEFFK